MTFKKWFDDMQERYQAYYGGYEELLQEAFEAGAKQEREACAKIIDDSYETTTPNEGIPEDWLLTLSEAIRARGEA